MDGNPVGTSQTTESTPLASANLDSVLKRNLMPRIISRGLSLLPATLTIVSFCLLIPGMIGPCFTVIPSVGLAAADALLWKHFPELITPRTVSLIGGISSLYREGDILLGTTILLFSVLFPLLKSASLMFLCLRRIPSFNVQYPFVAGLAGWSEWFVWTFGSWSMLDVFVVAIIIIGFKQFPGGTQFFAEWGLVCFGVSVFLSMCAALLLKPFTIKSIP